MNHQILLAVIVGLQLSSFAWAELPQPWPRSDEQVDYIGVLNASMSHDYRAWLMPGGKLFRVRARVVAPGKMDGPLTSCMLAQEDYRKLLQWTVQGYALEARADPKSKGISDLPTTYLYVHTNAGRHRGRWVYASTDNVAFNALVGRVLDAKCSESVIQKGDVSPDWRPAGFPDGFPPGIEDSR